MKTGTKRMISFLQMGHLESLVEQARQQQMWPHSRNTVSTAASMQTTHICDLGLVSCPAALAGAKTDESAAFLSPSSAVCAASTAAVSHALGRRPNSTATTVPGPSGAASLRSLARYSSMRLLKTVLLPSGLRTTMPAGCCVPKSECITRPSGVTSATPNASGRLLLNRITKEPRGLPSSMWLVSNTVTNPANIPAEMAARQFCVLLSMGPNQRRKRPNSKRLTKPFCVKSMHARNSLSS
mmetsp:Transcript_15439/g.60352  ORF Transcript_15439/g.60352 Transcript_15439/m.60352 type:complete len:240 (-) Transcript_15439:727-1446(-)